MLPPKTFPRRFPGGPFPARQAGPPDPCPADNPTVDDLTDLSLHQAAARLRAGQVSSRELTDACLARIAALDPRLAAFLAVTPELARAGAAAADQRLADWRRAPAAPLHPLTGVPLAIKDVLCLRGAPTTAGSRILPGFQA